MTSRVALCHVTMFVNSRLFRQQKSAAAAVELIVGMTLDTWITFDQLTKRETIIT